MRPLIPGKRTPLDAAHALEGPLDLVESWKAGVRFRLARQAELARPTPSMKLQVDLKLVVFAAAFGVAGGPLGVLRSLLLLLSILWVHESSRALLARALGRSARVSLSLAGGQTEISGPELSGAAAFAFTLIGSLANVLLAGALHRVSGHAHDASWGVTLRELATGHAIWGVAQALPLLPFRAGRALSRRLPASLRSGHAIASGGLAIGAVFAFFNLPKSPVLVVALLFVAFASARAAFEAFQEEFDRQNGITRQVEEARVALDLGDPRGSLKIARAALEVARSKEQRQKLWSSVAWAGIGSRDPFVAHAGLQHLPGACLDLHLLAAYLCCCGRAAEAQDLVQEARALGQTTGETSKLLIEILFAQGDREGALAVTQADAALLSDRDRRAVMLALDAPAETSS